MAPAHRAYYEARHGRIGDGLEIDHLCRVTLCVNPDHLEPVTPEENKRRAGTLKLNAEIVSEIRERWDALPRFPKSGRVPYGSRKALAREYGIDSRHLAKITRGRAWADRAA